MVSKAPAVCVHVWEIEPPNGHTSPGTCRRCGLQRDFLNSCDEVLAQAAGGRPLDFRAPRRIEEETVAKTTVHTRHREIQKRWPEILRTIEETGSINKAAEALGLSYSAIRTAAGAHGIDVAQYTRRCIGGKAQAAVRNLESKGAPAMAGPGDDIGQALIGVGLVMIGAWLKKREGGG